MPTAVLIRAKLLVVKVMEGSLVPDGYGGDVEPAGSCRTDQGSTNQGAAEHLGLPIITRNGA